MSRESRSRKQFQKLFKTSPFSASKPRNSVHPYGDRWPELSRQYKKEANYTCEAVKVGLPKCGNRYPPPFDWLLHSHHIIPWLKSKNNKRSNIAVLCKDCHAKCHAHMSGQKAISDKQKRAAKRF